jgi:hypothetical protein
MPSTIDDVRKATDRLKNKRLPGPENIIAQLLKIQRAITEVTLHKTVRKELFLNSGRMDLFELFIKRETD